ncbi:tRNA modification GTPase MnmE [bacterium BMS3Abin04]|nr:tRNA modification GTPase MnmE [bacterium BMS3Abin04]
MLYSHEDTITAIATPIGVGAISVIRVSGSQSIEKVDSIFRGKKKLEDSKSHTIHYGRIYSQSNEVIDDVLISIFKKPNSYTGEDSIEISTHGNPLITQKIIDALLENNVRLAEPGEFTKRAFLNGRMDLAQAEAVADVINSRTEVSLHGARNQLDGLLSKKIDLLREMLIHSSSLIELELDFAEEDIQFVSLKEVKEEIEDIIAEIEELLKSYSFGKIVRDGVKVALVGQPNVGKSSLLNYMLKESRAIVSHIPGTTRDVISEEISVEGLFIKLFDTAGIRFAEDDIEKEGVERSRQAIENADIVIYMFDVTSDFGLELYEEIEKTIPEDRIITVANKIDLGKDLSHSADAEISALTGEGIPELFSLLKEISLGSNIYTEKSAVVSSLRHYNILKKAKENLFSAVKSIENKLSGEFIAVDLRNAENLLGEIIGKVSTDDILNNIFSKFCIGK